MNQRQPRRRVGSVCEVVTDRPVFHLSFDDGPHPEVTPLILDVLDDFDASATFFLLTEHALRYPDVVNETLRRGHDLGLHGRTHLRLSTAPWRVILDEIHGARSDLEELVGRRVDFFRPPFGDHGRRSLALTVGLGMKTVLWSVDTYDWKGLRSDEPLPWITAGMAPGGIVLVHDTPVGESMADENARGLLAKHDLTRIILETMSERGLRPVSARGLLMHGREVRRLRPAM